MTGYETVSFTLRNPPLLLVLDHERCTLSNAVIFLQKSEPRNALPT